MKKFITSVLFAIILVTMPNFAYAFEEAPVALIVFDKSYNVNNHLLENWQQQVKKRFRFPNYKLQEYTSVENKLLGNLPTLDKKAPYYKKTQLVEVANTVQAQVVFVLWVHELNDYIVHSWRRFGEDFRHTEVSIDFSAYSKKHDKIFSKKIRYSKTEDAAISVFSHDFATQAIYDAVSEFRDMLR